MYKKVKHSNIRKFQFNFLIFFPLFLQPRLGPKPFTSMGSNDITFDKVFSVPQVPGTNIEVDNTNRSTESSDSSIDEQKDGDEKDGDSVQYRNGNGETTMQKSDSLEKNLQRAISTAERRKVCRFEYKLKKKYINILLD